MDINDHHTIWVTQGKASYVLPTENIYAADETITKSLAEGGNLPSLEIVLKPRS
jgi:hypothetical protein